MISETLIHKLDLGLIHKLPDVNRINSNNNYVQFQIDFANTMGKHGTGIIVKLLVLYLLLVTHFVSCLLSDVDES